MSAVNKYVLTPTGLWTLDVITLSQEYNIYQPLRSTVAISRQWQTLKHLHVSINWPLWAVASKAAMERLYRITDPTSHAICQPLNSCSRMNAEEKSKPGSVNMSEDPLRKACANAGLCSNSIRVYLSPKYPYHLGLHAPYTTQLGSKINTLL